MSDLLVLATSISTVALLVWLSLRAWRTKNSSLKWCGAALGALFSAVVSLIGLIIVIGLFRLNARTVPAPDLGVAGTSEQVVRGQAISDGFCSGCHSTTSPVTGGFYVGGEDLPVPIGSFVSSNLTPAGQLSRWSDGEIFRAIRNGVDRDGRWLIVIRPAILTPVLPHLRMLLSHVGYSADGRRVRGFVHARTIEGTGGVAECPLHAASPQSRDPRPVPPHPRTCAG
jgi:hypothetical protein